MKPQYVKRSHSSTILYTNVLLFCFQQLYSVTTATGKMSNRVVAAFIKLSMNHLAIDVDVLKWVTISFTVLWDDTFHHHKYGLTSHCSIFTSSDASACLYYHYYCYYGVCYFTERNQCGIFRKMLKRGTVVSTTGDRHSGWFMKGARSIDIALSFL